jgi:hypothetical protein
MVVCPGKLIWKLSRMSKIRMVHLSDIHFGQEDKDGTFHHQEDVRDAVTRDCDVVRQKLGPANGILVTGDIAFAGKKAEYDRAGIWLDKICDVVGCERRAVHIIPGNHDVDRSRIDYGVKRNLYHGEGPESTWVEPIELLLRYLFGRRGRITPHTLLTVFRNFA